MVAAASTSSTRYVIRIKAGVYWENVEVPSSKMNMMLLGVSRTNTFITGSRNVVDGSKTFDSVTSAQAVGIRMEENRRRLAMVICVFICACDGRCKNMIVGERG